MELRGAEWRFPTDRCILDIAPGADDAEGTPF
jgi:hypothetical protein